MIRCDVYLLSSAGPYSDSELILFVMPFSLCLFGWGWLFCLGALIVIHSCFSRELRNHIQNQISRQQITKKLPKYSSSEERNLMLLERLAYWIITTDIGILGSMACSILRILTRNFVRFRRSLIQRPCGLYWVRIAMSFLMVLALFCGWLVNWLPLTLLIDTKNTKSPGNIHNLGFALVHKSVAAIQ